VAFASSLDQIGPLTRTVREAALALQVLAGHDPQDATSRTDPVPRYVDAIDAPAPKRIGVPRQLDEMNIHPGVRARFEEALFQLGREPVVVDLPTLAESVACYYILAPAEASSNLARFDAVRYGFRLPRTDLDAMYSDSRSTGFGVEVKRRILVGTFVLSAGYMDRYYRRAQAVRARLRQELDAALGLVDALVMPTTPTPAFRLGEKTDPVSMYLADVLTIPASLAGLPAISVPMGLVDGLPVGMQVMGRYLDEWTCLAVGAAVERATGGPLRPPLWVGEG
jgi:aspartyl-tRNA(Asn)/glutamyl-tRNA(Gln) amidotransferase subunit A